MAQPRTVALHRQQGGFALAAVLWLLAGLTVLVTTVSTSMLAVARTNRDLQTRVRLELAAQKGGATVAAMLLTQPALGNGLQVGSGVLPLDGRLEFSVEGEGVVRLQDIQGLLGLNSLVAEPLLRLVVQCGSAQARAAALIDTLQDYVDADSLKRLNGAERLDYLGLNLPVPRNDLLVSRAELWRVLGWAEFRPTWDKRHCDDWVSLAASANVNLWTAPLAVLLAVGMDPGDAKLALAERDALSNVPRLSPLLLAFRDRQGSTMQALSRFDVRSRGEVRVTVSLPGAPLARQFVLSRTGNSHLRPYLQSEVQWVPAELVAAREDTPSVTASARPTLDAYIAAARAAPSNDDVQVSPLSPLRN